MQHKTLQISLWVLFASIVIAPVCFGATVTGTIQYDGDVPQFKEIKMDADPICLAKHAGAIFPETLVLGEGKTLANVLVSVKGGLAKKEYPAPSDAVVLNQEGCQYKPHVFGAMVGQKVKILNPDGTLHNVHALPKTNAEFNLAMPQFRKEVEKIFDKEETTPFAFKCDVHPWMTAWAAVFSHPYYSVTQKDGKFTIANLDAGTYEISAWHEKLGEQAVSVTVGADETKEVNLTFAKPAQ